MEYKEFRYVLKIDSAGTDFYGRCSRTCNSSTCKTVHQSPGSDGEAEGTNKKHLKNIGYADKL